MTEVGGDPVREYLRRRGAADHVVEGGLEGLVASWERIAAEAERGYESGFDDWLNALDCRQLIEEARPHAGAARWGAVAARIEAADARLRAATVPSDRCLWGEENANREGWRPAVNWWYWRTVTAR